MTQKIYDVCIIGGGINGCGIARDMAGRGISVKLVEMGDIGGATSSASTKLFHGGLRYLEYFEFGLVKKALAEREVLLNAMPHISWPLRFVLPYHHSMRFDTATPTTHILNVCMPWLRGRRPKWLIRLGLFIYDSLGGRKDLPATRTLNLHTDIAGNILKPYFKHAYEYSDCWVQDARLVSLNVRDAAELGADISPRTKVLSACRKGDIWQIACVDTLTGIHTTYQAKALINATGQWIEDVLKHTLNIKTKQTIRLVRGSHIVVKKLYDHNKAYFLQGGDGRIMFVIPYEQDYTLIGTTDVDHIAPHTPAVCSDDEVKYMCDFVNTYLTTPIYPDDVVWTYAGIRPLYDNGVENASATTRDYTFSVHTNDNTLAPVVNIFGGKITTYRKLAESAFALIGHMFPNAGGDWTAGVALSGGDFKVQDTPDLIRKATTDFAYLDTWQATRLMRCYGTDVWHILHTDIEKNGIHFGKGMFESEIKWLIQHEFAQHIDDILWRRTKMGLHLKPKQITILQQWLNTHTPQ